MIKRILILFISSIVSLLLLTKCVTNEPYSTMNWRAQMNLLAFSMGTLLPLSHEDNEFYSSKNESQIKGELNRVHYLAKHIQDNSTTPKGDPIFSFAAKKFTDDMNIAYSEFIQDHKQQALFYIQNTPNYCITCHSRTDHGRSDIKAEWETNLAPLNSFEKADYYFAVRHYKKGLDQIFNSKAQKQNSDWVDLSYLRALAIATRVKQDPALAKKVVLKIKNSKTTFNKDIPYWLRAIENWKSEQATKSLNKILKAKKLITRARKYTKESQGYIEFLRASSLLHDVLLENQKDNRHGDALLLAGIAAQPLKKINLWTLHEAYFETCITTWPHSNLAKRCFKELKDSLLAKNSMSGIPSRNTQAKLEKLQMLSQKTEKQ